MNSPAIRIRLAIGAACVCLAGCQPAHKQAVRPSKPPEDPTSWSASPITKGAAGGDSAQGFDESDSIPGSLSKRGSDIEKSLGVGLNR